MYSYNNNMTLDEMTSNRGEATLSMLIKLYSTLSLDDYSKISMGIDDNNIGYIKLMGRVIAQEKCDDGYYSWGEYDV